MFKASTALFLYAETSLHLGSGESLGAIDLAIQRERYTGFPCGAAQGIKGPIRDWFERTHTPTDPKVLAAFGPDTSEASKHAGAVAFTDARLLLFPVRSMKGVFAWITCPFALGRLRRDLALADEAATLDAWRLPERAPQPGHAFGTAAGHATATDQQKILLEEEVFDYSSDEAVSGLATWLADHAFPAADEYAFWRERLPSHLLVLHDDDFRHFVKTATEVQARIKLGPRKTTTHEGNLFYQENLPADSLLYAAVLAADALSPDVDDDAEAMLHFARTLDGKRLQIGGDETTGKGYVYASFLRGRGPDTRHTASTTQTQEATP